MQRVANHEPWELNLIPHDTYDTAVANAIGGVFAKSFRRAIFLLEVTGSAGVAGDVLDVFVDVSFDKTKWLNVVHFTQVAGNSAALTAYAVLSSESPGTAPIVATADANSGAVRPTGWGRFVRGRYTLVDAGAHGQSVTFMLKGLIER
jgi:hypothetical protein